MGLLSSLLSHPLTRGLDLDDPQTTELRKKIILSKPFLRKIYEQWYAYITENLPQINGPVLELGTGAGFLEKYIPDLITSDLMPVKGCGLACNALNLPFQTNSLRAIVMMNVLHHIPNPDLFFQEGARCVKNSGVMVLIEPWVTPWSRVIYSKLHHEPFEPEINSWNLPDSGPLSGGNDALPWIIFSRDVEMFRSKHQYWKVEKVIPCCPFNYLLSGGVSMRSLMPGFMFEPLTFIEKYMSESILNMTAMFSCIIIKKGQSEAVLKHTTSIDSPETFLPEGKKIAYQCD